MRASALWTAFGCKQATPSMEDICERMYEVLSSISLLGSQTKFTTLSELSFTTRHFVRLMRNRPLEQMEGAYDRKQQLEEHLRSALRHLWCMMSFKARLVMACAWPIPCRGSIELSESATSSPISRALCSHRFPPSVCSLLAVRPS